MGGAGYKQKMRFFFIGKGHDMSLNAPTEKWSSEKASLDSHGDWNSCHSASSNMIPCNAKGLDSRSKDPFQVILWGGKNPVFQNNLDQFPCK